MSQSGQHLTDAAIAAAGSKVTYGGAGGTVVGVLFSSEVGVLVGILVGLTGLAVNCYFKRREDRRLQLEHEMRMKALRGKASAHCWPNQ